MILLQVSDQLVEELLLVLKEEGVSVQGKEESLRSKLSGKPYVAHLRVPPCFPAIMPVLRLRVYAHTYRPTADSTYPAQEHCLHSRFQITHF